MDNLFSALGGGRLKRKPIDNPPDDDSQDVSVKNNRFARNPIGGSNQKSQLVKQIFDKPVRYGANRRLQRTNQSDTKQQNQTKPVPTKNVDRHVISRQTNKQQQQTLQVTAPESKITINVKPARNSIKATENRVKQQVKQKEQNPRNRRNTDNKQVKQQKVQHNVQQSRSKVIKRDNNTEKTKTNQAEIPAAQLSEEKTEQVKKIIRAPLNRRSIPPVNQPTKTPAPDDFIDSFIRPVVRQTRYGGEKDTKSEIQQTPKRNTIKSNKQETPIQRYGAINNSSVSRVSRTNRNSEVVETIQTESVITQTETHQKQIKSKRISYPSPRQQKPEQKTINLPRDRRYQAQRVQPIYKQEQLKVQSKVQQKIQNLGQVNNRKQIRQDELINPRTIRSKTNTQTNPKLIVQSKLQSSPQTPLKQSSNQIPIKRSNLIIHLLHNLSKKKINNNFLTIRQCAKSQNKKSTIYSKLLLNVLTNIVNNTKYSATYQLLQQLNYQTLQEQILTDLSSPNKKLTTTIQNISIKKKMYLGKLLDNLYLQKMRNILSIMNSNKTVRLLRNMSLNGFVNLQRNKLKDVFREIHKYSELNAQNRRIKLEGLNLISKSVYKEIMANAFYQLRKSCIGNNSGEQSKQVKKIESSRGSRKIQSIPNNNRISLKSQKSLNKQREQLAKKVDTLQLQQITNKYQQEQQAWKTEQANRQQQIDIIRGNCLEQQQGIDEKRRIEQILKERVNSIEVIQDNLIEEKQLNLQETKFSELFDVYVDLLKENSESTNQYTKSQLQQMLPDLSEDVQNDQTAQKWKILMKNKGLKEQVNAYEGIPMLQRKVARSLQTQSEMITGMARSYIKQKYLWEWVKIAVKNIADNSN